MSSFERAISQSGAYSGVVTPVPISNTEVKHACADDTFMVKIISQGK